jgi:N-acetylglucosaminyltransferase
MTTGITTLIYLPYFLIALVIVNRYVVGALVRTGAARTVAPEEWPGVTITIPCFNEGEAIYHTVRSLASMDYPQDRLTIHVTDDASGAETRRALERALADTPNLAVSFRETNRGKRLNLVDAVREARTDLVLSVDSDVVVERDTLKELVRHLIPEVAAVGGVVRVVNPDVNLLTRTQEVKYYVGYEFLKGLENRFQRIMCLSGCLTLYRRHVLLEVEGDLLGRKLLGQDVKYGEDRYLTRKIVERGYRTRLCQTAICYTKVPETFAEWFSQQLRWRRSNIVDFLGGCWRAHLLPLPVAVHYLSLGMLLLLYPLVILHHSLSGEIILPLVAHGAAVAALAGLYMGRSIMGGRGLHNIDPLPFLAMPVLFMVNYVMLTPLALLTLVTVNWETRSAEPKPT